MQEHSDEEVQHEMKLLFEQFEAVSGVHELPCINAITKHAVTPAAQAEPSRQCSGARKGHCCIACPLTL